jgi:peptidoglycan/xylan/chitin deacetylase (PgdA/CDA1 family)
MTRQINVVFRFDDYSAKSSTDMELRIIDAFRQNKASVTFAVIPFIFNDSVDNPSIQDVIALDSSKGCILKDGLNEGVLDVALHGYSHQAISIGQTTEFSGLDYNDQLERLAKGKKFLEDMIGSPITTFVPPWNTYDSNTLIALEKLSFSTLSASINGETKKDSKLTFLPSSSNLSQLRDSVEIARVSSDPQSIIIALFHEYDFKEISEERGVITYQEFSNLLNWLQSQEDVRLLSISQATQSIDGLGVERFLLNQRHTWLLSNLLHSYLQQKVSRSIYYQSPKVFSRTLLKIISFYLAVTIFGAMISIMMWVLFSPMSASIMKAATFASTAVLVIILIHTIRNRQVRDIVLSAGVFGVSVGLWLGFSYSFS